MYRFALRPMWLLSHFLVLTLVVVMINLGFWQLRRLDDRQARNDLVTNRVELPVEPVDELLTGTDLESAVDLEWRRVTATGTYRAEDEVLVLNRSFEGAPGAWVLTPLALEDGPTVMVNRGWVNFALTQTDDLSAVAPVEGAVRVEGLLRATRVASGLQVADPAEGVLDALGRPDLARLAQQLAYPILPAYIELEAQTPAAPGVLPAPVEPPELDEGPHLSYAMQWFIFSAIALVGYPLVLHRVAHGRGRAPAAPDRPGPKPRPGPATAGSRVTDDVSPL